jgi:hypothetical protein
VRLSELFYTVLTCSTKLVIATMLLRLVPSRRYTWILWISMVINVAVSVSLFLVFLLQCKPIAYAWRQIIPTAKGTCSDLAMIVNIGYLVSAVSIALDFLYAILPGFMFWDLQMETKKKVVLIGLMSMGLL